MVAGCVIMNWLVLPAGTPSRLGVITGRKAGAAVARSRMRRLMREAFRLHQRELRQPVDLVLVARASMAGRKMPEVERDVLSALRQARLLIGTA
jgi:ribonuclease P protein component